MQKAAANFAAAHLSGAKLDELSKIFQAMDANHDGTIDKSELEQVFHRLTTPMSPGTKDAGVNAIDSDTEDSNP